MSQNPVGKTLIKQYRIDAYLASGGMGTVYRVWDQKRNVPLAMKVLHEDLAEDPSIFKRFQREARALEKLAHPNIVPFYGLHQTADFAFLLERYIDGPTLKKILQKHGKPLEVDDALVYLKAMTSALGYAHAHGVVHCDVKPENVMVDKGGSMYLTDFGVARHAESTTTTLGFAGTAAYMAPEQYRRVAVSAQTDVYALGVTLYEMLMGERPFRGNEEASEGKGGSAAERVRWSHVHMEPRDPREANPRISEAMAGVILKALAKDSGERYPSMRELYEAACGAAGVSPEAVLDRVPPARLPAFASRGESQPYQPLSLQQIAAKPKTFPWYGQPSTRVFMGVAAVILTSVVIFALVNMSGGDSGDLGGENRREALLPTGVMGAIEGTDITPTTPTVTPSTISTALPTPTKTPFPTVEPVAVATNKMDNAEVVFIPAGEFIMGSNPNIDKDFWGAEGPQHPVYLDEYWVYRTEITNAMYQECVAEQKCPRPVQFFAVHTDDYYENQIYADYPVIYVSYGHAISYCHWVGGRLPTEAEWEKAARGTDARLFPWGDSPPGSDQVNLCDRTCARGGIIESQLNDGFSGTSPVGNFPAGVSPYGAFDMAGNVWEWTFDWFHSAFYSASPYENPNGPVSGTRHVIRGGSWSMPIGGVRVVARKSELPDTSLDNLGFRCVMDEME